MRLHYKTPCITRVFLSKISSTVYANVSTDEADALRGERVEGRASNLSLLKEARAQKRERGSGAGCGAPFARTDTEPCTRCDRDRSEGPRRARREERTKGVERIVVGVDGSETSYIPPFSLPARTRFLSGGLGTLVPSEKERKRRSLS